MPFSIHPFRSFSMVLTSLIALLLLSNGPAYAEWVRVGESQSGTTIYVDPDTIRRKGDLVKIWELFDYKTVKTVNGISSLSFKAQRQFDCAEERSRGIVLTEFSGNMGNGSAVFTDSTEQKWGPVAPDSVDQFLWKIACAKQ